MPDGQSNLLGAFLREARVNAGLSKSQLAERIGVHFSYIGKLEAGKKQPSTEVLQRIASALDLDANGLLALSESMTPGSLPPPRMYFRRKFGLSDDEAIILAQLVEHQLKLNRGEPGDDEKAD